MMVISHRAEELLNGHSPAGPLRGNKYSAFEGGTRIPAIVRWPRKLLSRRCRMYWFHKSTGWPL